MIKKKMEYNLLPHQKVGLKEALKEPFYALFMEPGTGKTLIAIKAIEERYKQELINRVIIFAPNTILLNWELEIRKFISLPSTQYIIEKLDQGTKPKRVEALNKFIKSDLSLCTLKELKELGYTRKKKTLLKDYKPKLQILIVNFEKARVMFKEIIPFKPHMLVVDESHKLKSRTATMSKNIYKLTRTTDYRLILTGTPVCNGYEDLFMQYKILDENVFGPYYNHFENRYIVKGGYMNYSIVDYNNVEELKEIMQETSYRVRLEECIKLPSVSFKYLTCDLGSDSQKAYNEMNKDMITQLDELSQDISRKQLKQTCKAYGIPYKPRESYLSLLIKASDYINTASCDLAVTKIMRLQQITGGFLTLDSGYVVPLGKEKLNLIKEIVEEATQPIVIFCQYVAEIDALYEELSQVKRKGKKLEVRRYRKVKDREQTYKDFQEGKVDIIILQMSSGSVGLNLQRANKLVFYSWNFNSDDYTQAIARIKRNGQNSSMEIIHLIANNTIDLEILNSLKHKGKLAKDLLD